MAVFSLDQAGTSRSGAVMRSLEVGSTADIAFGLICEVEKWPVWLSFVKSARRLDSGPIAVGSEIALRGAIPGEPEELYEVDRFVSGHIMSLVGAYSIRRRIDFRAEGKSKSSRIVVRVDYPAYGGVLGMLLDRMTARRRLEAALGDSLIHFKGLVEFGKGLDQPLEDF